MVSFIQISIFAHELTSLLDIKVVMSKKDNTEQAILQAAETEFLDKGFALAKLVFQYCCHWHLYNLATKFPWGNLVHAIF